MTTEFDIVIVGGGLYGSACAYFLAQQQQKVLLVEKHRVGTSGATGYSRGIVRVFDTEETLAGLSLQGAHDLLNWEQNGFPGLNPYTASGFVYLMNESKEPEAQNAIRQYGGNGYPMELLTGESVAARFPWIREHSGKIALYEARGGYGDPRLTAQNFMEGFRQKGGSVYENCAVEAIEPGANGHWRIRLPFGYITAPTVLMATGAYTKNLLPEIPVFTCSIPLTQVNSEYNGARTSLVDETVETFLRPGDDHSFYCGSQVFDTVDVPEQLPCRINEVVTDAVQRIRQVVADKVHPINCFTGFDGYTTEKKPVLQYLANMPGIYVAAGFSGRGYKCAVPIAQQVAGEILGNKGTGNGHKTNWRITI